MKKIYFIAAACAAMCMASCSNEILEESALLSDSNLISFNVNAGKSTKADITTANITEFNATAIIKGKTTKYFDNVKFAKNGQSFSSATPYYWPESDALNFFAYAPVTAPTGNTLKRTDYKTFVVTPSTNDDADYLDFIYANTNEQTKADQGKNGVALNFRHAESKILVKVKNTAPNLKFVITDWKLAYLDGQATFTYADASTAGTGLLANTDWTGNTDASVETAYTHSAGSTPSATVAVPGATTSAIAMAGSMILIPQQTTMASKYAIEGTEQGEEPLNGSYIGFKFQILNNESGTEIFSNKDDKWAIWPVSFNWEPGKQYTYIVDLCGGGYYEENDPEINPDDPDQPDPILGDDAIIKFVEVTVDEWSEQTAQEVNMPLNDAVLKAASSFKPLSDGSIAYSGSKKTATLSVKSTDFQTPAGSTNPNDNNAFKDVKSFFDGLQYIGTPVQSIKLKLKGTDYVFTWDATKKCWYNAEFQLKEPATTPGSSIEAAAATTMYEAIAEYINTGSDADNDFILDASLTAKVKNGQNVTEYTDTFKFVINVTKVTE